MIVAVALGATLGCDSSFYDRAPTDGVDAGPGDAAAACPTLADFRLELEIPTQPLEGETRLLVPLGNTSDGLLTTVDSPAVYFELSPRAPSEVRRDLSTPGFIPRDGVRVADTVWLAGSGGGLWRATMVGDRLGALEPVLSTTRADDLTFLDGVSTPLGPLLLAMSTTPDRGASVLLALRGTSVTTLWGPGPRLTEAGFGHGDVRVISEAEAYAVPRHGRCTSSVTCVLHVRLDRGTVSLERLDGPEGPEVPTTVAAIDGVGVVVGTQSGRLYVADDTDHWTPLATPPVPQEGMLNFVPSPEAHWVRAVLALRDGALAFVTDRWMALRLADGTPCGPYLYSQSLYVDRVLAAAPYRNGVALVGQPAGRAGGLPGLPFVGVVEPIRAP